MLFLGHVMAAAPEPHRTPGPVLPWLPLPAILGFSLLGLGGSIALTFTTFSYADAERLATPTNSRRVYEARAVPFDSQRENPAQRAEAISRALTATQAEVRHAETVEPARRPEISEPLLLADSNRELRGFPGFGGVASRRILSPLIFRVISCAWPFPSTFWMTVKSARAVSETEASRVRNKAKAFMPTT